MDDAREREGPHEGPTKHSATNQPGRYGRRRTKPMSTLPRISRRKPPRWPASGNAVRLDTMSRQERIAQIVRELLTHHEVRSNDRARALAYEALALAEQSRRELGEARPG